MSRDAKRESAAPVIGLAVIVLVILGLGFWFFTRDRDAEPELAATTTLDSTNLAEDSAATVAARDRRVSSAPGGMGAGVGTGDAALFEGRDIHEVPLGEILDHAQSLSYDEARGHEATLGRNAAGQTVKVSIWPQSGASSMVASSLGPGRIVARIESNHGYEKLGLADGLNYLWVESRPGGGYRGVIIPATAFVPLHDLDRVRLTETTPTGVPLEKGAYWVNGEPWVACGRC